MRALLQRAQRASVQVNDKLIGQIDAGLVIFICAMQGDTNTDAVKLAAKVSKLRIFRDDDARMNRSLLDVNGQALIVSQFTLGADTSRGNRPGFSQSANPDEGKRLYQLFIDEMKALGINVETGEFGADMQVSLINDGPVTIWMDTEK